MGLTIYNLAHEGRHRDGIPGECVAPRWTGQDSAKIYIKWCQGWSRIGRGCVLSKYPRTLNGSKARRPGSGWSRCGARECAPARRGEVCKGWWEITSATTNRDVRWKRIDTSSTLPLGAEDGKASQMSLQGIHGVPEETLMEEAKNWASSDQAAETSRINTITN